MLSGRLGLTWLGISGLALAACGGAKSPSDSNNGNNNGNQSCSPAFAVSADAAAAEQHCIDTSTAVCARAFTDCGTELADIANAFVSQAECETTATDDCTATDWSRTSYEAGPANTCLNELATMACASFLEPGLTSCDAATGLVPPAGDSALLVEAGTVSGVLTNGDPQLTGSETGFYDLYFLCLTAGQVLELKTAAGSSGGPADDTLLFVFDKAGATVAKNDDDADGPAQSYYSHIPSYVVATTGYHLILVAGYDETILGSYKLTLTLR